MVTGPLAAFAIEVNARCTQCDAPVVRRGPQWPGEIVPAFDQEGPHRCGSQSSVALKAEGF